MMSQPVQSDVYKLRQLERRLAAQQHRIEQLERIERRFVFAPAIGYEWECDHCPGGWIVHDGDELHCTDCGYLQYL
jgi:hypothetical protein